jgi:predicted HTH transcriptional regulator
VEKEVQIARVLPELALKIVDHATQHGRVTIGEMIRMTGASRNTLKEHFRSLVVKRHLVQHGKGKGSWYALQ